MSLRKNFPTILLASLGIGLILGVLLSQGCATTDQPPRRIVDCLTDPGNNALHCDGVSKPWGDAFRGYVCRSIEDDAFLREKCR